LRQTRHEFDDGFAFILANGWRHESLNETIVKFMTLPEAAPPSL
jgi:hypothetical protein